MVYTPINWSLFHNEIQEEIIYFIQANFVITLLLFTSSIKQKSSVLRTIVLLEWYFYMEQSLPFKRNWPHLPLWPTPHQQVQEYKHQVQFPTRSVSNFVRAALTSSWSCFTHEVPRLCTSQSVPSHIDWQKRTGLFSSKACGMKILENRGTFLSTLSGPAHPLAVDNTCGNTSVLHCKHSLLCQSKCREQTFISPESFLLLHPNHSLYLCDSSGWTPFFLQASLSRPFSSHSTRYW